MNFAQTYRSQRAVERPRNRVATTAIVLLDRNWTEIRRVDIVPDDVIRLSAGNLTPADSVVLAVAYFGFVVFAVSKCSADWATRLFMGGSACLLRCSRLFPVSRRSVEALKTDEHDTSSSERMAAPLAAYICWNTENLLRRFALPECSSAA